jgi:uridine phosphorylase
VPLPSLPEGAILTHQGYLLPRRWPWKRDARRRFFSFDLRLLSAGAVVLAGVRGVGAPATAIAVEEMAVTGVRGLVAVDIAGSLTPDVPSGSIVLATRAVACDGTSPHYAREPGLHAAGALTDRLGEHLKSAAIAYSEGAVWSTDAVYRETPSELAEARRAGAVLADLETASVFAVSSALGIEAAALLVAADELHDSWRPPADMRLVQAQVRRALAAATACLMP